MDLSYNIKGSKSHISSSTPLLLYQYSYTALNFNTTIVPPPISKDWTINLNDPSNVPPPPPKDVCAAYHKSISLTLAILSTFLQIKYQQTGPFETHPNTMAAALWATLLYFVASSGQICSPAPSSVPRHCVVWSGNVVVASLASLFAPDLIRPLLYGVAVLLSGGVSFLLHWQR